MPFLSEFINTATVFTQARSPSVDSRPSHASLFTGKHAAEHNLTTDKRLRSGSSIWEFLRDECGYETGIFTSNPFFHNNTFGFLNGFDKSFTTALDLHKLPYPQALDPRSLVGRTIPEAINRCIQHEKPLRSIINGYSYHRFVRNNKYIPSSLKISQQQPDTEYINKFVNWTANLNKPWAAFLNLMSAHYPYQPGNHNNWGDQRLLDLQRNWTQSTTNDMEAFRRGDRPWWELMSFEHLYDGAIKKLDSLIERLVVNLKQQGEFENTHVVITADHGENFGEPSEHNHRKRVAGHGSIGGLHEERVHVPLITRVPQQSSSKTIRGLSSLIHLPKYIKELTEENGQTTTFRTQQAVVSVEQDREKYPFAIYEDNSDIVKFAAYGDSIISNTFQKVDQGMPDQAQAKLAKSKSQMTDANVCVSQRETISSAAQTRLRELGYID